MSPVLSSPVSALGNPLRQVGRLVIIAGLCVMLVVAHLLYYSYETARDSAEQQATNLVRVLDSRLTASFQRVDAVLAAFVSDQDVLRAVRSPDMRAQLTQRLRHFASNFPELVGLHLFDGQGDLIATSSFVNRAVQIADRAYFIELRRQAKAETVISDVLISRTAGRPSLVMARRFSDGQGGFGGVAVATIELAAFDRLISDMRMGGQGAIYMRRTDNDHLVLHQPSQPAAINQPAISGSLLSDIHAGLRQGIREQVGPLDEVARVYAVRVMEGYPFYLGVGVARADYLGGWYLRAVLTLAIVLFGGGVVLMVFRRLSQAVTGQYDNWQRLQASEQRLNYVMSATGEGLWDWDLRQGTVSHNSQWLVIAGVDDSYLQHPVERWEELMHPVDRATVQEVLYDALMRDVPYIHEYRIRRPDGHEVWVFDRGAVVERDADGQPLRMVGSISDISARKAVEHQLAQLSEEQATLLENQLIGIAKMHNRSFVWANPAFESIFGYGRGEMAGCSIRDLYPSEEDFTRVGAELAEFMHQDGIFRRQLQFVCKDGRRIWGEICGMRLNDAGESLWACIDITARKEAELELVRSRDQAEAANRAKSTFLANMSHELRTPLNAILGMTGLVLSGPLEEEAREHLQVANTSARALLELVNKLIDYARLESGGVQLTLVPISLAETLMLALQTCEGAAAAKGLAVECDCAPDLPEVVEGDPLRLRELLSHLLDNAVKFTSAGEIRLAAALAPCERPGWVNVHLSVSDTGIGIDPGEQERIFEAFHQVDASTTRGFEGAGLGLAICRELVRGMQGRLWVESSPGQGSTFHCCLPLQICE